MVNEVGLSDEVYVIVPAHFDEDFAFHLWPYLIFITYLIDKICLQFTK